MDQATSRSQQGHRYYQSLVKNNTQICSEFKCKKCSTVTKFLHERYLSIYQAKQCACACACVCVIFSTALNLASASI